MAVKKSDNNNVQIYISLSLSDPYHVEVVNALKAISSPDERKQFIIDALLYYKRSPSYRLLEGIQDFEARYAKLAKLIETACTSTVNEWERRSEHTLEVLEGGLKKWADENRSSLETVVKTLVQNKGLVSAIVERVPETELKQENKNSEINDGISFTDLSESFT